MLNDFDRRLHLNIRYTERDSKIGFGIEQKLSRIDDQKSVHIRNMGRLLIADPRGFRQTENSIFESRSVYMQK
jgi:hypothetical protein